MDRRTDWFFSLAAASANWTNARGQSQQENERLVDLFCGRGIYACVIWGTSAASHMASRVCLVPASPSYQ